MVIQCNICIQYYQFLSRYRKCKRGNQSKYAKLWLKKANDMKNIIFNGKKKKFVAVGNRKRRSSKKKRCIPPQTQPQSTKTSSNDSNMSYSVE